MRRTAIFLILTAFLAVAPACGQAQDKHRTDRHPADDPVVVLETNRGEIELRLFPQVAPKATENFTTLVERGYYDGITFHRVIKGFMIQGGDPTGTGREDEVTPKMTFARKGLLAMANAGPHTNGSQFFITTAPAERLNMRHTIFGEVIKGYETVEEIENTPTDSRDRPRSEQKILKAYVKEIGNGLR